MGHQLNGMYLIPTMFLWLPHFEELLYEYWVSVEVKKYLASHNKNTLVIFDDCNLFIPSLLHTKNETLALQATFHCHHAPIGSSGSCSQPVQRPRIPHPERTPTGFPGTRDGPTCTPSEDHSHSSGAPWMDDSWHDIYKFEQRS